MLSRTILFLFGICVFQISEAQIHTDSFENFSLDISGNQVPNGWKLLAGKSQPANAAGFVSEGLRSVQLSNDTNELGEIKVGLLQSAFPISQTPAYFNGNIRLLPMALAFDTCELTAWLTRWNDTAGKRDTIYKAVYLDQGFHNSMRAFSVPFHQSGEFSEPDSCIITVKVTRSAHPRFASTLYTDQISLTDQPMGIKEQSATINAEWNLIRGNDGTTVLSGPENNRDASLTVFDLAGKTILETRFDGDRLQLAPFNTEGWLLFLINTSTGSSPIPYFYQR